MNRGTQNYFQGSMEPNTWLNIRKWGNGLKRRKKCKSPDIKESNLVK